MSAAATDLQPLADWLRPLLASLQPAARRRLAARVARDVRRQTQRTMRAQTDPEGQPWEKRKADILQKNGPRARLRKKVARGPMFKRLARASNLKTEASPDAAVVAFAGRVQRIASVHHWGLVDRVAAYNRVMHTYAERPLLGISDDMQALIRAAVIEHLTQGQ